MVNSARIAAIVDCTEAEGPGRRFALWFQGCPLRCPGCCNPEFLPFEGGQEIAMAEIRERIRQSHWEDSIEGVTLLGGEPMAHADAGVEIARTCRELGLSVMIFTGYTLEELRSRNDPVIEQLLSLTDLLVDGPYDRTQPDMERRWIGSRNQRIHCLTERYRPDDPCWRQPNTLEIRVRGGEILVNGFPERDAAGLWKGWRRKR